MWLWMFVVCAVWLDGDQPPTQSPFGCKMYHICETLKFLRATVLELQENIDPSTHFLHSIQGWGGAWAYPRWVWNGRLHITEWELNLHYMYKTNEHYQWKKDSSWDLTDTPTKVQIKNFSEHVDPNPNPNPWPEHWLSS